MKPLKNLLLIEVEPREKKTESGLYLKESWEAPKNIATVKEKGPLVDSVDTGQRVMINPFAVIDTDQENVKLIKESDILAVYE